METGHITRGTATAREREFLNTSMAMLDERLTAVARRRKEAERLPPEQRKIQLRAAYVEEIDINAQMDILQRTTTRIKEK